MPLAVTTRLPSSAAIDTTHDGTAPPLLRTNAQPPAATATGPATAPMTADRRVSFIGSLRVGADATHAAAPPARGGRARRDGHGQPPRRDRPRGPRIQNRLPQASRSSHQNFAAVGA